MRYFPAIQRARQVHKSDALKVFRVDHGKEGFGSCAAKTFLPQSSPRKAAEDAEEIRNRLPAGQRLAHICRAVEDYIDTIP
jgi:hypothetical protein